MTEFAKDALGNRICPKHECLLEYDLSGHWCPVGLDNDENCLTEEEAK